MSKVAPYLFEHSIWDGIDVAETEWSNVCKKITRLKRKEKLKQVCLKVRRMLHKQTKDQAFDDADVNRDGTVTIDEMQAVLIEMDPRLGGNPTKLREAIEAYADEMGNISLQRFHDMLNDMRDHFDPALTRVTRLSIIGWSAFAAILIVTLTFFALDGFLGAVWMIAMMVGVLGFSFFSEEFLWERRLQDAAGGMLFVLACFVAITAFFYIPGAADARGPLDPVTKVDVLRNGTSLGVPTAEERLGWHLCHALLLERLHGAGDGGFPSRRIWHAYYEGLVACVGNDFADTDTVERCLRMMAPGTQYGAPAKPTLRFTFLWYDGCRYFRGIKKALATVIVHGLLGGISLLSGMALESGGISVVGFDIVRIPFNCRSHRYLGVVYVACSLGCSISGLVLIFQRGGSGLNQACVVSFAVLHWLTLIGAAVSTVRAADLGRERTPEEISERKTAHRRWFTCNYFVVLGALSLRLWYLVLVGFVERWPVSTGPRGANLDHVWQRAYDMTLVLPILTQLGVMAYFLRFGRGCVWTKLPPIVQQCSLGRKMSPTVPESCIACGGTGCGHCRKSQGPVSTLGADDASAGSGPRDGSGGAAAAVALGAPEEAHRTASAPLS